MMVMMVVLRMAVRGETSERGKSRGPGAAAGKSEGGSKAKAPPGVGVGRSGRSVK